MGRRDHLMRVALSANQAQIQEPVTPNDSDNEEDPEELAAAAKMDKIQRLDAAQEAVLSAIGFMSDAERLKKTNESSHKEVFSIATICGLVDYHLPLPLSCQRNSILVLQILGIRADSRRFEFTINHIFRFYEGVGGELVGRYCGLECHHCSCISLAIQSVCIIYNLASYTNSEKSFLKHLESLSALYACVSVCH